MGMRLLSGMRLASSIGKPKHTETRDRVSPLRKWSGVCWKGLKGLTSWHKDRDEFVIKPFLVGLDGCDTLAPTCTCQGHMQKPKPEFEPLRKLPGNDLCHFEDMGNSKSYIVDAVEIRMEMETNHVMYVWKFVDDDLVGKEGSIEDISFTSNESVPLVCGIREQYGNECRINGQTYGTFNALKFSFHSLYPHGHICEGSGIQVDDSEIFPDTHSFYDYDSHGMSSVESLTSFYTASEQETCPTSVTVDDTANVDRRLCVEDDDCAGVVLEEILEDMLDECLGIISFADFPLQAPPDLDLETLSTLGLSPITRLKIRTTNRSPTRLSNPRGDTRPLPYEITPPPYIDANLTAPPNGCEAPPPFPQDVTEIVDLVRMAASLIYGQLSGYTDQPRQLDLMSRLTQPWPDNSLTAIEGIELFREALNDGVLLYWLTMSLSQNLKSAMSPSCQPIPLNSKTNFYRFIRVYRSITNVDGDSLRYARDGTLNGLPIEDLASYARAIIMAHSHLSSGCVQPIGLEGFDSDCDSEIGESSTDGDSLLSVSHGQCTKASALNSVSGIKQPWDGMERQDMLGLPEDDYILYRQLVSVLRNEENHKNIVGLRNDVQSKVNKLQYLLTFPQITGRERIELLAYLVRFSSDSVLYPQSLALANDPQIDKDPVTCGHFGDILKGYVQEQGVCVKVVKAYHQTQKAKNKRLLKSFVREIVIWGQLHHPNILPFYGVYRLRDKSERICLVSPWMENGTLLEYVNANTDTDRLLLVKDVACGLVYLHSNMIVHGDLKSINILVTVCGRACIADFGLSSVDRNETIKVLSLESSGIEGGTPRYEAPELLADTESRIYRTTESDMYAFGCICYEIYTGLVPFYEISSPYAAMTKIIRGERPQRPTVLVSLSEWGLTDEVWSIITSCWKVLPGERPSAQEILSSEPLSRVVDTRLEDQEMWTPSKYRSTLHYVENANTTQAVVSLQEG